MAIITITKQVKQGDSVSIKTTPNTGYEFNSYSGSINGTTTGGRTQENGNNPLSFNASTNSNITANFKSANEGRIEIRWYNSVNEPGYGYITRTSASLNTTNKRGVKRIGDYGNAISISGTLNSGRWTGYYEGNIAGFAISDISSVGFTEEGGVYPGSSRSNVYYADFSACTSMTQFGNSGNDQQFYYHNTIETVKLPSSIQSIYFTAFAGSNIKTLYIYATTPPSISGSQYSSGDIIFSGCSNLRRIYVPAGSVNAYKSATAWSYYSDKITAIIDVNSEVNPVNSGTVSKAASETSELSNTQSSTLDGLILTASGNSNYSFSSWKRGTTVLSSSNPYTLYSPDNINGTDTIIAEFLPIYTISASVDPSSSGTISGTGTYNYGDSCTVSATANTGYNFVNWTEGGSTVSSSSSYTFTVSSSRTLVANFELETITISAGPNTSGYGTVSGTGSYSYGDTVSLTANAASGYEFTNWTENGTTVSTSSTYTFTATQDRTLVANFAVASYTISASVDPSGSGTISGTGTYNYGASVSLVATAASGYEFVNWTENGTSVSSDATYTFTATQDRTLVANFAVASYTISASASPYAGGTVSGGGSYNYGDTCTLRASVQSGYAFSKWTEDGTEVSTSSTYSFTVSGNRTLKAVFTLRSYTISASVSPSGSGTVSGTGTKNYGTTCTLTATAASGYVFSKWTENGTKVSTSSTYSFTVSKNRTLVAVFTVLAYSISASVSPSGSGSVSGTGYKNYGTTATLVATANSGYEFKNWTESGTEVSTSASYSFTVSGARALVANFQQITPITITTTGSTTVYLKNNSDQTYTWNLTSGTNTYSGNVSGFELSNLKSIYKYTSTPSDSDFLITSIDISGTSITNISERSAWGACKSLTSVIFPETITTFGREAFWNCEALANITFPASVSSIGKDSFNGCSGLSYIRFKGSTVPTFLSNSFSNTNNCTIYVPSDAVDTYKAYSSIADRVQAWPY